MSITTLDETNLSNHTQQLLNYCHALFNEKKHRLPASYQADLETIRDAAVQLQTQVQATGEQLHLLDTATLQKTRHDYKNCLNLVLGYTQLLLRETHSPLTPLQQSTLHSVYHSARELLDLIENLR
jgi:signal transduction histidine kinase